MLGLSPMQAVLRELRRRGIELRELDALEMFGGDGMRHTIDYYRRIRSLELWELNSRYLPTLKKKFGDARLKIVDTFEEIRRTSRTFNLIVDDNPGHLLGRDKEYCEHFDLAAGALFRVAREWSILIFTVVPEPLRQNPSIATRTTYLRHMSRRSVFYGTDHPHRVTVDEMLPAYRHAARASGFETEWSFYVRRTIRSGTYYLVLKVRRAGVYRGGVSVAEEMELPPCIA